MIDDLTTDGPGPLPDDAIPNPERQRKRTRNGEPRWPALKIKPGWKPVPIEEES